MKTGIHPALHETKVKCACGASYTISGTLEEIHVEICMECHPHYTGKKKLLDTEGRVDKFMAKFREKEKEKASAAAAAPAAKAEKKEEVKKEAPEAEAPEETEEKAESNETA